jgi:hypothetical protein
MRGPADGGVLGDDPLDSQLENVSATSASQAGWRSRWRAALGLTPTGPLALLLLPLGMALGPVGLDLISERVLTGLSPAVAAALTALGVLIGLRTTTISGRDVRLAAIATCEGVISTAAVAGALALIQWLSPGGVRWPWPLFLFCGACAAPSASAASDEDTPLSRIVDLDDLLPIMLGAAILAFAAGLPSLSTVAITGVIALAVAAAGALLVSQTASDGEQRVFVIGTILLLAGVAEQLEVLSLFIGLIAGILLNVFGQQSSARFEEELRYLQHPLVALLLVVAGASVRFGAGWLVLLAIYVAFRTAGKLVGGWWIGRTLRLSPGRAGLALMPSGLIGVALALSGLTAHRDLDGMAALFGAVVVGAIAADAFAVFFTPGDEAR